jgi:hypothetical protein
MTEESLTAFEAGWGNRGASIIPAGDPANRYDDDR